MSPWTALGWLLVVAVALPVGTVALAIVAALIDQIRAAARNR